MALFGKKGVPTPKFGTNLGVAMKNWVLAESFAQLAAKPASFYYLAGRQPAPNAQELIDKAHRLATLTETHAQGDAVRLQEGKPQERDLGQLHRCATGFFLNMALSLMAHNVGTLAAMQGQDKLAAKRFREGLNAEGMAFKIEHDLKESLQLLRQSRPHYYEQLGLYDDVVWEWQDGLWRCVPYAGSYSIWSVLAAGDDEQ